MKCKMQSAKGKQAKEMRAGVSQANRETEQRTASALMLESRQDKKLVEA